MGVQCTLALHNPDPHGVVSHTNTQFEKADNKPALLGWGFAGLSVFLFSEWLIHLPLFNFVRVYWCAAADLNRSTLCTISTKHTVFATRRTHATRRTQLLGFPIQMLGLFMLPYLGVRYGVEGKDFVKDASEAVVCGDAWMGVVAWWFSHVCLQHTCVL